MNSQGLEVALALVRLVGALALLLAPGYLIATRVVPASARWFAAPFASAAILFAVLLGLHLLSIPLIPTTTVAAMAIVTIGLWAAGRRRKRQATATADFRLDRWWLFAIVPLGSAAALSVLNPLSGFDNVVRWDHLPRIMLAQQSLAGYPPVSAADFEVYAWCDGIPPLVSFLNYWVYSLAGWPAPVLSAARVIGELALVAAGVALLSRRLWGPRAGGPAVAAATASSLLLWSIGMGQETGLLAAALVGTVYFLVEYQQAPAGRACFWAAVAAGVGAITREYGLAYILFGGAVLLALRARPRELAVFAFTAAAIAAPWYLRNWVLTGNPLFPHLSALFPGNEVHDVHSTAIAREWSFFTSPYPATRLPRLFLIVSGLPVLLGLWGLRRCGRPGPILAGAIALQTGLWLWSVPQTAAGWIIAFRVLGPAVALLAALSGWVAEARPMVRRILAGVLALTALDASFRLWQFPLQPGRSILRTPAAATVETAELVNTTAQGPLWRHLVKEAGGEGIVVDHPRFHLLVIRAGGRPIPLFSPLLAPTLSPAPDFPEVVRTLRQAGIRFVCFNFDHGWSQELASKYPFWGALRDHPSHLRHPVFHVYDLRRLDRLTPVAAPSPAPPSDSRPRSD